MEKQPVVTKADDQVLDFLRDHHAGVISEAENKRVLRKIDLNMMPMMMMTLMLNFIDKMALAKSVNFGLIEDLGLVGTQYNWVAGSAFYLAYLVSQPLVARQIQRFPIGRYISVSVITWGILLMCTAATKNFAGVLVCRVLLGATESCVNPAFMIMTSMWYTREEQPQRMSAWNMGLSFGTILGGFIGFGIGHIQYKNWSAWPWFFIIYGAITFVWGIFLLWWLPDTPMNAKFLTEAERVIAVERVRANKTGISNKVWKWYQFWECMRDPLTWFSFVASFLGTFPSGGVSSFGSIVIKGFGFSALNTTLLQTPQGVIQLFSFVVSGYVASRWPGLRLHLAAWSQIPPIIGSVLLYVLPSTNKVGRLLSFYIVQFHNVLFTMGMAVVSSNVAGYTKKTTMSSLMFIAYCVGQISGPQVFRPEEAPIYKSAFVAFFSCLSIAMVSTMMLRFYLIRENKRRDKLVEEEGLDPINADEDEGFHDKTDWELQKTFRYVY